MILFCAGFLHDELKVCWLSQRLSGRWTIPAVLQWVLSELPDHGFETALAKGRNPNPKFNGSDVAMRLSLALLLSAAAVVLSPLEASAADPNLSIILPRGGQRGTEQVFRFSGARLQDAEQILFYEPGFEVLEIKAADANNIDVKVKIAPDCAIGEHTAQVRTKSGISDYRTFFVGALAGVDEKEPNTDFAVPQAVELNVTVSGTVDNEDVDYYVVNATKGQRISVEVEGMPAPTVSSAAGIQSATKLLIRPPVEIAHRPAHAAEGPVDPSPPDNDACGVVWSESSSPFL